MLARNERSAHIASELGARHVVQIRDTVFGVDVTNLVDPAFESEESYDVLFVAASLAAELGPDGMDSIVDLMTTRVQSALVDHVVVTAQSGANGRADFAFTTQVAARCAEVAACRLLGPLSVEELLGLYRKANVVVTARVHGGIMVLLVGTPALVLCPNSTKALDLFGSVGFAEVSVGPEKAGIVIQTLRERLEALGRDSLFLRNEIAARITTLRSKVVAADQELVSLQG